MNTYHIHINGIVQGVGFRPFVYKLAYKFGILGTVKNSTDGVHIFFNSEANTALNFYNTILSSPPINAVISNSNFEIIPDKNFDQFIIEVSTKENHQQTSMLMTPDIAICQDCKNELYTQKNKRHLYPFITCLNCGPRYSIIQSLPYDRENTTMSNVEMCKDCNSEYHDPLDRRHFSQTNSCKDCAIEMHLFNEQKNLVSHDAAYILQCIDEELHEGKILAVKGIGGYLLLCDATNDKTIQRLRKRKNRISKPFAVLYTNIDLIKNDVHLSNHEIDALKDKTAPIVLCKLKTSPLSGICKNDIAPGLDKIGVMLPYTGLLALISDKFCKPIIATSANLSGSPILFRNDDALNNLLDVADQIITYDRDIVVPQDDSVLQFTETAQQKIIIRRSRGLAPNYFPNPFSETKNILAMGGELKSAFAYLHQNNLFVSQFLGDQESLDSQNSYAATLKNMLGLLSSKPEEILIDKHPGYAVSQYGKALAAELNIKPIEIQHHKAHFAAVIAENNLLKSEDPILGIIWDGIGYGDDKQIWGGEIFSYQNHSMERIFHLEYFPYFLGDKMSNEPRISAFSLLQRYPEKLQFIKKYFTENEWNNYQKLISQNELKTSSIGRFLDGLASILNVQQINNYEGEAAMKLEVLARSCKKTSSVYYSFSLKENKIEYSSFLKEMFLDIEHNIEISVIADKIFNAFANLILQISDQMAIDKIAFSGGVFQNALLVDKINQLLFDKKQLIFHQQLSPNDECIGFGQIAFQQLLLKN